jgi:hypothetical protein
MLKLTVILLLLAAGPILADEGRIPVWEPGTIDAPGHYILTRDIATTATEAIVILSDGVTLDLGGRTISLDPATLYGIRVDLSGVPAPHLGVVIVNGRIKGGGIGIYVPSIIPSLKIEGLEVVGTSSDGIHVSFDGGAKGFTGDIPAVVISNSLIHGISGDGVMLADPRPSPLCSITISGNVIMEIDKDGLEFDGCADAVIKDNKIMEFGLLDAPAAGIRIVSGAGGDAAPVVDSNVIGEGGSQASGIVVSSSSPIVSFLLDRNTISNNGASGIEVLSGRGRIKDNLVSDNGADGLLLSGGVRILIDGNYVADNLGYGLYFAASSEHAYRDNFLRGNRNGALGGENNTDAGGNIQ